jgi:hypothetical protein
LVVTVQGLSKCSKPEGHQNSSVWYLVVVSLRCSEPGTNQRPTNSVKPRSKWSSSCGRFATKRFEEFFAQKAKTRAIIGISQEDSHLTILKRCLKLLTHKEDGKTEALAFYALANLPSHLDDIADPTKLGLLEKDFIETEPFKVLTNEDIIERHWQNDADLREIWVDRSNAAATV